MSPNRSNESPAAKTAPESYRFQRAIEPTSLTDGAASRNAILFLAIALFLGTRGYLLFAFQPMSSDVEEPYFSYAVQAADERLTPYQGDFRIDYPPLAWWVIYAPRLLDSQRITDVQDSQQVKPVFVFYNRGFRGVMFGCDVASFILLILIVRKRRPQWTGWAALTYTLTTTILSHLLYDRLDMGLLLFILLWAYCWVCSLESQRKTIAWSTAAYLMLGLGISFKLVPVICVPFLLLADWYAPQRSLRWTVGLASLIVAAGLPFLIQYIISGPALFTFIIFHSGRGIAVESLFSTLMILADATFHIPAYPVTGAGGPELSGALSTPMILVSNVLMCGLLGGTWLWAVLRRGNILLQDGYRLACFVMAGAVILSKVFSPQYLIWSIPLMVLLAIDLFPPRKICFWMLTVLLVIIAALTTWIFPYHFIRTPSSPYGLVPLHVADGISSLAACVVSVRNFVYLATVVWFGVNLFRKTVNDKKIAQASDVAWSLTTEISANGTTQTKHGTETYDGAA